MLEARIGGVDEDVGLVAGARGARAGCRAPRDRSRRRSRAWRAPDEQRAVAASATSTRSGRTSVTSAAMTRRPPPSAAAGGRCTRPLALAASRGGGRRRAARRLDALTASPRRLAAPRSRCALLGRRPPAPRAGVAALPFALHLSPRGAAPRTPILAAAARYRGDRSRRSRDRRSPPPRSPDSPPPSAGGAPCQPGAILSRSSPSVSTGHGCHREDDCDRADGSRDSRASLGTRDRRSTPVAAFASSAAFSALAPLSRSPPPLATVPRSPPRPSRRPPSLRRLRDVPRTAVPSAFRPRHRRMRSRARRFERQRRMSASARRARRDCASPSRQPTADVPLPPAPIYPRPARIRQPAARRQNQDPEPPRRAAGPSAHRRPAATSCGAACSHPGSGSIGAALRPAASSCAS